MSRGCARWLVLALLVCSSCGQEIGPALFVTVDLGPGLVVSQLRVIVTDSAGGELGPLVRPDNAGEPLASGESLRLLLPEELEGDQVAVSIEGLSSGEPVAAGRVATRIAPDIETAVRVSLGTVLTGAQPPCTSANCAGCCVENHCQPAGRRGSCEKGDDED